MTKATQTSRIEDGAVLEIEHDGDALTVLVLLAATRA